MMGPLGEGHSINAYVACAVMLFIGFAPGYMLGRSASTSPSTRSKESKHLSSSSENGEDDESGESDESDESDDESDDGTFRAADVAENSEGCKMIVVVRTDLGMGKGKIAAQCGHGVLANYKHALAYTPQLLRRWEMGGQPKIVVKCDSEEKLVSLMEVCRGCGVNAHAIRDAGRTQIAAGSMTVLAVGPGLISTVSELTGHLKLM